MNERIKLLAEQATTIEYGVDNGFDRATFDKEKFALLIIRECMRVVEDYYMDPCSYADEAIKEHFGVEE